MKVKSFRGGCIGIWLFCCILCQKAKEEIDHILWGCEFARSI